MSPVVDILYPPRCPLCGEAIAKQDGLCAACWQELELLCEPACESCNWPLLSERLGQTLQCGACLAKAPLHDGIIAAARYSEASRQLVLKLKHGGKIGLAKLLGRTIAARMPDSKPGQILVPVPLHPLRLWQRGYNQSALLAGELALFGKGELLVDALSRVRYTPSLGGLDKGARVKALNRAIAIRASCAERIRDAHVVLVDDVLTSGATSDACVRVLKRAGAKTVTIACFARVIG
jgi:ComF family protein